MNIVKTEFNGLYVVEPRIFGDSRGYFFEKFCLRELEEMTGPVHFVQDNESRSSYGVVRGLHFQDEPYAQAKLVGCVLGKVLDVVLDLRKDSPTYGKHFSIELSSDNHLQMFVPKGFAHGFSVLSNEAVFQYKCDEYYHPEAENGLQALDPALGIDWKIPEKDIIMSAKDRERKCLSK